MEHPFWYFTPCDFAFFKIISYILKSTTLFFMSIYLHSYAYRMYRESLYIQISMSIYFLLKI